MNKPLVVLSLFLAVSFTAAAQGIDFFKGTWEEALEQARTQDKLIFVDAYATWCGPCKMMASKVFPEEKAGAFFNRHFISLKIDMEAPENETFRSKYPVSAFPTLFFINAEGTVVHSVKGAQDVDKLIGVGEKALALSEPTGDYAEQYAAGNREPELVYKYVRAMIRNGESHLKVANDYLRSQQDLNSEQNLQFLLLAATEADSRLFDMMAERKEAIVRLTSEESYYSAVLSACKATAKKAIEFSSLDLLKEAQEKLARFYAEKASSFQYTSTMEYASAHRDAAMYASAAKAYAKDIIKGDAAQLNTLATDIAQVLAKRKHLWTWRNMLLRKLSRLTATLIGIITH
ncbi:MAG: thioredoxin family protein [Saprospiraceae bacterium]